MGCGVYYWLWVYAFPYVLGYRIRQEVLRFENGAQSHKLVKVPVAELERWDATHDAVGRRLDAARDDEAKSVHETTDLEK